MRPSVKKSSALISVLLAEFGSLRGALAAVKVGASNRIGPAVAGRFASLEYSYTIPNRNRMPAQKPITAEKRDHYTWSLTDAQIHKFEAWRNEIWITEKRSPGAIGGEFTFKIIGTSIGTMIVADYRDGEKTLDLTDYHNF
jgi:hypothetical protein